MVLDNYSLDVDPITSPNTSTYLIVGESKRPVTDLPPADFLLCLRADRAPVLLTDFLTEGVRLCMNGLYSDVSSSVACEADCMITWAISTGARGRASLFTKKKLLPGRNTVKQLEPFKNVILSKGYRSKIIKHILMLWVTAKCNTIFCLFISSFQNMRY